MTKNGFRRHTSKSPLDNKYKFCYTITTVKVWWTTKWEQEAPGNFSKSKPISFIERTKTERRKKVYLISEFSGRHNGYGLRARYIGSIPRNPLIRRHTSKSHKKRGLLLFTFKRGLYTQSLSTSPSIFAPHHGQNGVSMSKSQSLSVELLNAWLRHSEQYK